jgi:hypothetical protein
MKTAIKTMIVAVAVALAATACAPPSPHDSVAVAIGMYKGCFIRSAMGMGNGKVSNDDATNIDKYCRMLVEEFTTWKHWPEPSRKQARAGFKQYYNSVIVIMTVDDRG